MKYKHGGNVYEIARKNNIKIDEIIDFSANINPLGISEKLRAAIIDGIPGLLNYPDPEYKELKAALSVFSKTSPDHIVLGNGAIESIFFLMEFLKPRKSVIVAPTFIEYERALMRNGSEVDYFQLCEEDEFRLDTDRLMDSLSEDLDLIVICNPNNPTGKLVDRESLLGIIDGARKKGISVFIDEAFNDFVEEPEAVTLVPYIEEYDNVFILKSLTKFFAMPGLRMGYIVTSNHSFLDYYRDYKEPWHINYLADRAVVAILNDKDYIESSREIVERERVFLFSSLNQMPQLKPFNSSVNYLFFKNLSDIDLSEALLGKGIMIRNCGNYQFLDNRYYRIAVKNRWQNEKLIGALKEIFMEAIDD